MLFCVNTPFPSRPVRTFSPDMVLNSITSGDRRCPVRIEHGISAGQTVSPYSITVVFPLTAVFNFRAFCRLF